MEELLEKVLKEFFDSFEIVDLDTNKRICHSNDGNIKYNEEKEISHDGKRYLIRIIRQNDLDELTKLPKRKTVIQKIEELKKQNIPFLIVMIDANKFKEINDTYGHLAGDEVLKCISSITSKNIKSKDLLARWGGDEFVAIMPGLEKSVAQNRFSEINERLKKGININGRIINFSISYGIEKYDYDKSFDENYQMVDNLLYEAKRNSKNQN